MANEFVARNGIISLNNLQVTGSITATGGIIISGSIASASFAQSSSYAVSSSNAISSSYSISGSYAVNSTSASYTLTASYFQTSSVTNATSASFAATASSADSFFVRQNITASNILATGGITAQTLNVQQVTSSIVYSSGSNIFGNSLSNTQQLTGSVTITGSLSVNGFRAIDSSQTASMSVLSSSFAATASYFITSSVTNATSASYAATASYFITSSVTNATSASYAATASYFITSSVTNATSASYALTASYFITSSVTSASFAISSSNAISSSYAISSSNAISSSYAISSSNAISSSYAISSSNAISSSYAISASNAVSASNSISGSYALTASYALNAGGGGVSAIYIANGGVVQGTASYFDFTGAGVTATVTNSSASISIPGGGGGGSTTAGQTTTFTQSVAADPWTFTHNLNTRTPLVQVYDTSYNQITPQYVSASSAQTVIITFGVPTAGYAVASMGGTLIVTGSNVILNQSAAAVTWSFVHNLNTQYPVFQVFNSSNEVVIPQRIVATDATSSLIYFPTAVSGYAVASVGGLSGSYSASYSNTSSYAWSALSSSFSTTSSFAQTASFVTTAQTASYVLNAVTSSFALTASYSLTGTGFPYTGSAVITGSLLVSQSFVDFTKATYVSGSFTGSLFGTASYATFALSASNAPGFTTYFSQSTAAPTWSITHNLNTRNPLIQVYDLNYNQLIPNVIVGTGVNTAEVRFDYSQSGYAVLSNGGGLYVTGSTSFLSQSVAATTWSFQHNLNSKYVAFEVYDANNFVQIPANIQVVDTNNANLYFAAPSTGYAIAQFSGINGAPNATTASYALTSSYVNALSQSVLLTGSMVITGSLTVSGSGTFTNIGPAVFSGSLTSTQGFTGSFSGTATTAQTASSVANLNQNVQITGSLSTTGTITAQTLVVQTITSSIDYITGSSINGSLLTNTHQVTGSLLVTGSLSVNNTALYLSSSGFIGMNTTQSLISTLTIAPLKTPGVALNVIADKDGRTTSFYTSDFVSGVAGSTFRMGFLTGSGNTSASIQIYNTGENTYGSLLLNNGGGNVGIGTTNPQELLHVSGSSPAVRIGGIRTYLLQTVDADGRFRIHDNTAGERFTIASGSGYVGINTSTQINDRLDVYGSIRASVNTSYFTTFGYTGGTQIRMVSPSTETSDNMVFKIDGASSSTTGNKFLFQTQTGNTTPVTTLSIDKNGDVSIGTTTSPKYQVLNLINDANTAGATIGLARSGGQFITNAGAGDLVIGNATGKNILFGNTGAGTTEYMRITSGGNVCINTTSGASSLNLKAPSSNRAITFFNPSGADGSLWLYGTASSLEYSFSTWSTSNAFYLYNNGNYSFAGSNVSDRRLKQNITTIELNAIEKINQLVPKSYNMIAHPEIKRHGFIAQEVQEIIPDFVIGEETDEDYLGIDYNGILALAVKAIQELKAENDSLKSRIEALENK